jgi:cytochrome c-type biogenesis protein CcmH/NrfG
MLTAMRRLMVSLLLVSVCTLAAHAGNKADTQLLDALRLARNPAPEQAWARLQRVQAADAGAPSRAMASLQTRLKQKPDDGAAWFDLGVLHLVGSEPKLASGDFAKAAQYRPHDPYAHAYQGLALVEAGALKSAMGPLQTAIKLDPGNRFAKWALAQVYFRQGDHHQAARLLNPPAKAVRTASPTP